LHSTYDADTKEEAYAIDMNEIQEVLTRLQRIEEQTEAIFKSAEKTRKYFLATLIVTLATIILPLIGMVLVVPYYISTIDISSLGL
jgi:hypothetical protein